MKLVSSTALSVVFKVYWPVWQTPEAYSPFLSQIHNFKSDSTYWLDFAVN